AHQLGISAVRHALHPLAEAAENQQGGRAGEASNMRRPKARRGRHAQPRDRQQLLRSGFALRLEVLESRRLLAAAAIGSPWQTLTNLPASPGGATAYLQPAAYHAAALNIDQLRAILAKAPLETSAAAAQPLTVSV